MDKGYYLDVMYPILTQEFVAIHNKNGQGLLLQRQAVDTNEQSAVAIHNKNGQGLLHETRRLGDLAAEKSQSTIKMDKGYYVNTN